MFVDSVTRPAAPTAGSLGVVQRSAALAWLWAILVWSGSAAAQVEPCPQGDTAWVRVVFAGSAWSTASRDAVLRELRVELRRRSLQVCAESGQTAARPPEQLVTLLANDTERLSILPTDLEKEGGFIGRTVLVGAIPEDARALAIAQAVDEALRSDPSRPLNPVVVPKQAAIVGRASPESGVSNLVLGAALAPTLQVAPAIFEGAKRATVAPGMALRLSLRSSSLGGSLGVSITRASDLVYAKSVVRQFRLPLDLSLRGRLRAGLVEGLMDVGMLVAFVDYDHAVGESRSRRVEIGGRAGVSIGWGHRVLPWLGASIELLPNSSELRLAPTGTFGHSPSLWLGVALGTEVRWL